MNNLFYLMSYYIEFNNIIELSFGISYKYNCYYLNEDVIDRNTISDFSNNLAIDFIEKYNRPIACKFWNDNVIYLYSTQNLTRKLLKNHISADRIIDYFENGDINSLKLLCKQEKIHSREVAKICNFKNYDSGFKIVFYQLDDEDTIDITFDEDKETETETEESEDNNLSESLDEINDALEDLIC